jgi:hypothetical protein
MANTASRPRSLRRSRVVLTLLLAMLVMAGVAWASLPWTAAPLIRHKLQSEIAEHFDATLEIGGLRYDFPYGVRASNVRLVSNQDNVELFTADEISLALVRLPLRPGPLLIKRIELDRPSVKVVRTEEGIAGGELVKHGSFNSNSHTKLSDLFQLRLLTLRDGRVQYEDRRGDSDQPPVVWEKIQSQVHLSPQTASLYGWDFVADSSPAAKVTAQGTIDIDQLILDLGKLTVTASAAGSGQAALPSSVQQLLRQFDASGQVTLQASAHIPLRSANSAEGSARLAVKDLRATVNDSPCGLSGTVTASKSADDPFIRISLENLLAQTGPGSIRVSGASGQLDPQARDWVLTELNGDVENLALQLPGFERPFTHIQGEIRTETGSLVVRQATASYYNDLFQIAFARVPLADLSARSPGININGLSITAIFSQPQPLYPRDLGKTFAVLNPSGPYRIRGTYWFNHHGKDDFNLTVDTDNAEMAIGPVKVPVTNISGEARITPQVLQIPQLSANTLDGALRFSGELGLNKNLPYQAQVQFHNLQIESLVSKLAIKSSTQLHVTGRSEGSATLRGNGDDLSSLAASGDFQIHDGQLWELPILDGVAKRSNVARNALSIGQAAALFDVHGGKIHLSRAAMSSPALGIQGSGVVGFDGKLDLDITAAPLGDWRQQIRKTGIPILSKAAGELAGGIQQVINKASSKLLYEFRVKGTTSDPQFQAVPVPFLTDTSAMVFGSMLKNQQRLVDVLKER